MTLTVNVFTNSYIVAFIGNDPSPLNLIQARRFQGERRAGVLSLPPEPG